MATESFMTGGDFPTLAERRRGRFDALLAGIAFVCFSLLTGRIFRFPFDDEIFSLNLFESARNFWQLGSDLLHAVDVHPPLSYLMYYPLWRAGAGPPALRLFSVLLSGAAVVLAHRIVLQLVGAELRLSTADRVMVLFVVASTPLLISQGDAIRWYPVFTLLFMACLHTYLRNNSRGDYFSAILSGILASTNFLGFFVCPLLEFDRWVRGERRVDWPNIARRVLLTGVFAIPGILTLWHGLGASAQDYVGSQLGGGHLSTAVITAIGFFGGNSLGLVQSLAVVPAAILTVIVVYSSLRDPRSRVIALNVTVILLLIAAGFGKPRSFVYFALCMSILVSYRWLIETNAYLKYTLALIALLTPMFIIANVRANDTPYKRSAAVSLDEVIRFARFNTTRTDVIEVSDAVVAWVLKQDDGACVSLYLTNKTCDFAHARKLIVIDGYGIGSPDRTEWFGRRAGILAGRVEIATAFFGIDREAYLKRRLIPEMDDYILKGTVYEWADLHSNSWP